MPTVRPEHPLHRALCVLLCLVLLLAGGFGVVTPVASDGGCAAEHRCCCGEGDGSLEPGGCADACACAAPSTPLVPSAPLVVLPSLVDLATPPDRAPVAVAFPFLPAPRAWRITVASHPLPACALHVAYCVFLC